MSSPPDRTLRLYPLGGLGEIGMNCLLVESAGRGVLIDCGVTFPDRDEGVDVYHPSFELLASKRDAIEALVLTHGHEDHLGAVQFLLETAHVPVYAPEYARAQLLHRFEELAVDPPEIRLYSPGRSFGVGPLEIEAYRVHHSAPDAHGLVIRGPFGRMIHTGDFKIEARPSSAFDWEVVDRAAAEGVDLLLSDSTNIEVEGRSGSELDAAEHLDALVAAQTGRVVIALFGSNVARMGAAIETARRTGRKVLLLGRSVETHARLGMACEELDGFSDVRISAEEAMRLPRHRILAIATGTQGERLAALPRIALGTHPDIDLAAGDTVIFSSRIIPGAERAVFEVMSRLERRGVKVIDRKDAPGVHVSGHASRDELRLFLERVRPRAFIPVHGTRRHMERHAGVAREIGVSEVKVVENGTIVELKDGTLRTVGEFPSGRVARHRGVVVPPHVIRDRERLGEFGIVFAAIPVDDSERVAGPCTIAHRGALFDADPLDVLDDLEIMVDRQLRGVRGIERIEDEARRAMKRFFRSKRPMSPLVHAFAVELD
jgi:ribonuclease J